MLEQYNEYVLATAVQQGWITPERRLKVEQLLHEHPGTFALDVLSHNELLAPWQVDLFQRAISAAEHRAHPEEPYKGVGEQPHAAHPAVPATGAAAQVAARAAAVVREREFKHVDDYLLLGQECDASDVHLSVGMVPFMRRYGVLQPMWHPFEPLKAAETERLAMGFLDETQKGFFEERGDADFCYARPGMGRFRASVVKQRRGVDMEFRIITERVRTMDELGLPPELKRLTQFHNGLVLVTGPAGSGKSTTLAALVDEVNKTRRDHIITLEDPIEYQFVSKGCQVTQREVNTHTRSFATALRASLREDPDVIMVGEMRDLETISLAITASETGHLVLATLHTASAARTLDRILDVFPTDQQDQIRVMVSESLRGVISQQLVPRADGQGRILALEVLLHNPAVGALIRDGKTYMLPGVMQTARRQGMRLMDDSLRQLVEGGVISPSEGFERADNKRQFEALLKGGRHG